MIGPTKLCPQGIGLILLDLDGTILVDGTQVRPRVLDAINLARQHGCMVAVASGRAHHMVPEMLRTPEAMDYLVCANGARVYDTISGIIYERLMTREQVLAAMDALEPLGPGWNAFVGNHSYFEWRGLSYMVTGRIPLANGEKGKGSTQRSLHSAWILNFKGMGRKVRRVARFGRRLIFNREGMSQVHRLRPHIESCTEGIAKMGCSLPTPAACERAIATLQHMGDYEVARMSLTELEITAKGVTKGTSAQWLMDYLKIDPACAVAIGDSENDAPLAEVCGTFVAMADGDGRIKAVANDICETAYDDGVARWLERAMAEADGARNV